MAAAQTAMPHALIAYTPVVVVSPNILAAAVFRTTGESSWPAFIATVIVAAASAVATGATWLDR